MHLMTYNTTNECVILFQSLNQISTRIGSVSQPNAIYMLTLSFLYIKFPDLTNAERIQLNDEDSLSMVPIGFTITENYIMVQMANDTSRKSKLLVYKIVDYTPKLMDEIDVDVQSQLFGTENYLEKADYMYVFDRQTNQLVMTFYQGPTLWIELLPSNRDKRTFKIAVENFNRETNQSQEVLFINVMTYAFNNSNFYVDYSQLSYVFESSFIRLPLRDGIIGPLIEFNIFDNLPVKKEFLNGLYTVGLEDIIEKV